MGLRVVVLIYRDIVIFKFVDVNVEMLLLGFEYGKRCEIISRGKGDNNGVEV